MKLLDELPPLFIVDQRRSQMATPLQALFVPLASSNKPTNLVGEHLGVLRLFFALLTLASKPNFSVKPDSNHIIILVPLIAKKEFLS